MATRLVLLAMLDTACRFHDVDLTGKQCPCPTEWTCDPVTNTCTQTPVTIDASPDSSDAYTPLTYRAAVIGDAPIAYWRLDDTDVVATDELGHYTGTYQGTCIHGIAGALAGDPSAAVHFDGSTCKVMLPAGFEFPGRLPYSVEAWVREPVTVAGYRVIFAKQTRMTGPVDGYALVDSTSGVYFERSVGASSPTTAHTIHAIGAWVHLVGVYDGTGFLLYIDAVPSAVIADPRSLATVGANAIIGADSTGDYFNGDLDEIAVYDHALSADHIAIHHDLGAGPP